MPQRMCVGCRCMFDKKNLVRLVLKDEKIVIDKEKKIQSRGVYLCKNKECLDNAIKKKALNRIFKRNVDSDIYDLIYGVLKDE